MFNLKKSILDLLFPIECLGCKKDGEWLCANCFNSIKINNQPFQFNSSSHYLKRILVAADYQQPLLAKVIQTFKYNFIPDLGEILGKILLDFLGNLADQIDFSDFDLVIAVPLTKKRKLWRGFNQAEILAKIVSENLGMETDFSLLKRKYQTAPQVTLSAKERLVNVKGVFAVKTPNQLKGKKILLIDDVATTGATLTECAKVLKENGAKEVWALVVAGEQFNLKIRG
ncbi:MAG TPA: ComF family protein [Patescibacteria group bacterium]|nr:ComF family protein [Patescibacteria group bacterium]